MSLPEAGELPKTFSLLKTELDFCLVVRQFTPLYSNSAVLAHFNLGVVPMNNNPYLLVSFSLFGPCHLVQVVRFKAQLHYDEHESLVSITCGQDVQIEVVVTT